METDAMASKAMKGLLPNDKFNMASLALIVAGTDERGGQQLWRFSNYAATRTDTATAKAFAKIGTECGQRCALVVTCVLVSGFFQTT
jgi:hypothetical protein